MVIKYLAYITKMLALTSILLCMSCGISHAVSGLFGSVEFKLGSIEALPKWHNVLNRIEKEEYLFKICDNDNRKCANNDLSAWRDFIKKMKDEPKEIYLKEVNKFINRWPYIEDRSNWNKSDYWASPSEFLDKSGDCEDFAIIKYVTLKELGVNTDNMRIAVVMDKLRLMYHAVLVVYDSNNKAVIMDSLFDAVLSQEDILQYTPHYSVNENARWAHIMPVKKR